MTGPQVPLAAHAACSRGFSDAAGRRPAEEADMTEGEWLKSADPKAMLAVLRDSGKLSARKARLFAVACCRRIWHLLPDRRSRDAVEVLERLADDGVPREEVQHVLLGAWNAYFEVERNDGDDLAEARWLAARGVYHALKAAPVTTALYAHHSAKLAVAYGAARRAEEGQQGGLLRDIFGPLPFREVHLDPLWLVRNDGVVKRLAEGVYNERAFERMPVLADALEEAGCESEEVLAHLRSPGPHAKGCWVVDLILGKA
jgi:hypothetical protein